MYWYICDSLGRTKKQVHSNWKWDGHGRRSIFTFQYGNNHKLYKILESCAEFWGRHFSRLLPSNGFDTERYIYVVVLQFFLVSLSLGLKHATHPNLRRPLENQGIV